ncbi:cell division regulator GpsB [Melissococcus plutonius]|uniref:Cell cycle protein GpsB n=1 Tax=Melissococcus plutonius TaxID=33970 RepID=A0A2Z5Y2C3_9ENTE|nr:cell division regulator GpsB [Melissococcus plutonius]BAL62156.1 cell division protein GpsB [Melissococcus plutonius DAT561]MCV2497924.1 cell division regulator GpsB [Melissococcus plutonius]MCV2500469.1 cell division regulator GpsB [Melissococcus plutonius]MCV2505264.1 cell division regulator GpsB [Melissococcus plutonius]MCV2506539.1 cell division regulator GpsB [Melissococcus plutonius]
MANLVYSPKDILQKEFKQRMRGYDPIEVDEFLDNVIKDYEAYNKEILTLQEENNRLKAKLEQMSKVQQAVPRASQEAPKSAAVTNFDILKRLSNLEREVFGKKLDDSSTTVASRMQQHTTTYDNDIDNSETRQF